MEQAFKNFMDQVPSDIMAKTAKYTTPNLVIFRPLSYIIGEEIYMQDYHICLPTSTPPPTKVERSEYQFKKGRIITFTPETKVLCTSYAPTSHYIAMSINREFFRKIVQEITGKRDIPFSNTNNPYSSKLLYLIRTFEEEIGYNRADSSIMLESISTQMVIQLIREIGLVNGSGEKRVTVDNNYISLAVEYMTAFYNANIKIEDICKQIHLSPYYFIRMFKKRTGLSPHEFLLSVRVSRVEEMLKKGGYTIEEVARFCGFTNTAHLSSHFKKVKGISPSEYKKNYGNFL